MTTAARRALLHLPRKSALHRTAGARRNAMRANRLLCSRRWDVQDPSFTIPNDAWRSVFESPPNGFPVWARILAHSFLQSHPGPAGNMGTVQPTTIEDFAVPT